MSENKITDKKIKNSIDEFYTLYENAKQKGFLESKNFINSKPFSQTSEYVPQKEKFYERFEEFAVGIIEKEKEETLRNYKKKDSMVRINASENGLPSLKFDVNKGFENFKIKDAKAEKIKEERDLNGTSEKSVFKTLDNFTSDEVEMKTYFAMKFANDKNKLTALNDDYADYVSGKTDKIVNSHLDNETYKLASKKGEKVAENNTEYKDAVVEKKFYDTYVPLNVEYKDKKTGLIARAFGNKKNGKIEIFFGGSNNPSKIFTDRVTGLDWTNDIRSAIQTPPNYKVAYNFVKKIASQTYEIDGKKFSGIDGVNGFSKGGGEAMYVASRLNTKAVVIDPAPVINPGMYISNNKILAVIPNNGNGMLNQARQIPGTKLYTLEPKTGISEGKGNKKVSMVTAIPVNQKNNSMFSDHFPDVHDVHKKVDEAKKYAEKIKPQHYAYFGEEKNPYASLNKNKIDISNIKTEVGKSKGKKDEKNQSKERSL
jgi:putative uncharacterized protein (fragment)